MVNLDQEMKRIESKLEVDTYIDRLKYAISSGQVKIQFQQNRKIDEGRAERFTNWFTVNDLFPDEDIVAALKRELIRLNSEEYIETLRDTRFPKRAEMRVFGRRYQDDVYIKIRVELFSTGRSMGEDAIFVMSFHYAEHTFSIEDFPFKKVR